MGLTRIWTCDRCGQAKQMDPMEESVKPPYGWQIIQFTVKASVKFVLLCDTCMGTLYADSIENRKAESNDA